MVKGKLRKEINCGTCTVPRDDNSISDRLCDTTDILINRFNEVIHGDIRPTDTINRVFVSVINNAIHYEPKKNIFC